MLAEYEQLLDLAFLSAKRYTAVIVPMYYRVGLAEWHPVGDWWTARLWALAGPESTGVAAPSQGVPPALSPWGRDSQSCVRGRGGSEPRWGGSEPRWGGRRSSGRGIDFPIGLSPAVIWELVPRGAPGTS